MAELAQRGILVRRRARGTFIGTAISECRSQSRPRCSVVYVVTAGQWDERSGPRCGAIIKGLRQTIPNANVQFCFAPWDAGDRPARELVDRINEHDDWAGIVAMGCARSVYQCLADSRIPTVVLGSVYQGDSPLPSVDVDNGQAARLLTQHLIDRGHRRLALFAEGGSRPGDHHFLDGIHKVMGDGGFRPDALTVRFSGNDHLPPRLAIHETFETESPPTGIITRSLSVAEKIAGIGEEHGRRLGTDFEIAIQRFQGADLDTGFRFPCVQSAVDDVEAALQIGRMLLSLSERRPAVAERVTLPAEFVFPSTENVPEPHWHVTPLKNRHPSKEAETAP